MKIVLKMKHFFLPPPPLNLQRCKTDQKLKAFYVAMKLKNEIYMTKDVKLKPNKINGHNASHIKFVCVCAGTLHVLFYLSFGGGCFFVFVFFP